MGIRDLYVLTHASDHVDQFGGMMRVEEFPDTPDNEDEENASPPKPVDNANLPPEGDLEHHEPEPIHGELRRGPESGEAREEPNDLSEIDREFDDN
jgi:hypothetical protein